MDKTPDFLPRIFQWAGGKTKMVRHYAPLFPQFDTFIEPFAGGAALFSHFKSTRDGFDSILGDKNEELMGVYEALQKNPSHFIEVLRAYDERWALAFHDGTRKDLYYEWREQYWGYQPGFEASVLLYALMRTSFNGIWQTCKSSNGKFGTPVGLVGKPGGFFREQSLRAWSVALRGVTLHKGGYETVSVPMGSFVFCDPPYRDSFTSYGTNFGDEEQVRLIEWCRQISRESSACVWLANREGQDDFFERHAPDAMMYKFPVVYTAGRRKKTQDGYEAKPATELLMVWN